MKTIELAVILIGPILVSLLLPFFYLAIGADKILKILYENR